MTRAIYQVNFRFANPNLIVVLFQILLKTRDGQIQEISDELSNIHEIVIKEVETIRKKLNRKSNSDRKESLLAFSSSSSESVDKKSTALNNKKLENLSTECANNNKTKYYNDDYMNGVDIDGKNDKSNDGDTSSILDGNLMRQFIDRKREILTQNTAETFDAFDFLNVQHSKSNNHSRMRQKENPNQLHSISNDVITIAQQPEKSPIKHYDYGDILRAFGE